MRTFRIAGLAVGVVALAIAATTSAVSASAVPAKAGGVAAGAVTLGPSTIKWGACSAASGLQGYPGAQCAMLPVPLDYSHPNGAKIQLAISRVKHTVSAAKFQGVMLTNPGGPGGSGLNLSTLGGDVPNNVGGYYDWIGFDPRGVGASIPAVSCDTSYFNFDRPNYIPVQAGDLQAWLSRTQGYDANCAKKNGPILDNLTTIDSARDMDSIRAALGASQINYYGFSYGTYLGQVYSTLFPTRVRREVLDSNVDPRQVWYPANLDQDLAFNTNINIWFGWVAKYNSVYHLGATAKAVETLFYRTQAKLTFTPAAGKVGGDEWTDAFTYAAYYQSTWPELGSVFANFIHKNDVKDLENEYANDEGLGEDNEFAVYNGVQCTDVQYPQSLTKILNDNWATFSKAPFLTWANNWFNAPCQYWPAPAQAKTPFVVNGSKVSSALLIDETLDAATPFEGSLEVRKLFPNSSLIALPGGTSHANSLFGDACEDDQIAAYLLNGTRPARKAGSGPDATCAPLPQPVPDELSSLSQAAKVSTGTSTSARAGTRRMIQAVSARP
jgi:pimeloyl-ACP methyl ester carboxylesterase